MPERGINSGPQIFSDPVGHHDALRTDYRARYGVGDPFEKRILDNRPEVNVAQTVDYLLEKLQFHPENEDWITERDPLHELGAEQDDEEDGLFARASSYLAKVVREQLKGKKEAASYGWGKAGDTEIEIFAMRDDHYKGSIGTVVGEKFQQALLDAEAYNRPLVMFTPSGGIRQEEGMIGLDWMNILTPDLANFRKRTGLPVVLFSMNSYGGTPASIEGQASLRGGLAGTNRAFSGIRVAEIFQHGEPVEPGFQAMEREYLNRRIHMLARNPDEILEWLHDFFKIYRNDTTNRFKASKIPLLPIPEARPGYHRVVRTGTRLGYDAVEALMRHNQTPTVSIEVPDIEEEDPKAKKGDILYRRYRDIMTSPSRPDGEMLIRGIFTDVVPLGNYAIQTEYEISWRNEAIKRIIKRHPNVIAALGRFGNRTFGTIANQRSYVYEEGRSTVGILPSYPTDEDLRFVIEVSRFFEEQGYPLVSFVDTPGAHPMVDPNLVSDSIEALHNYAYRTATVVNGAHSSGGAAATAPMQDYRAGTERSIFVVADPYAQAAILNKGEPVTPKMVREQLIKGRASAQDNYRLGKIDEVIPEHINPYMTVREVAIALARYLERHDGETPAQLAEHRKIIREKRTSVKVRG